MSDKPKKTDWSTAEKRLQRKKEMDPETTLPAKQEELSIAVQNHVGRLDTILTQYKAKKIQRRAALEALQEAYDKQVDVFKHGLAQAARSKKIQIDVYAEQFLKDLDARHLEALTEIGLRNKDTRERTLIELTDQTAQKLKTVQDKDWPEALILETIDDLNALRKRLVAEIMQELGSEQNES